MDAKIKTHTIEIAFSEEEFLKLQEHAQKYSMGDVEGHVTSMLNETPDSILDKFCSHCMRESRNCTKTEIMSVRVF